MRGELVIPVLLSMSVLPGSVMIGRADTFVAPASVAAGPDGGFSYECVFTKGPGTALVAGYGWAVLENGSGGFHADCFCLEFCGILPGERIVFTVEGRLLDPRVAGLAEAHVALCEGAGGGGAMTAIVPFPAAAVPRAGAADVAFSIEPNPFSSRTTFVYTVPETGPVTLRIYDPAGRRLASVVDEVQAAGPQRVAWDARALRPVGTLAGAFFARLSVGARVHSRTLILVR